MPQEWVDPELFLEHNGVRVYHCYDDDDMVKENWFTTDPVDCNVDSSLNTGSQFDVRGLYDFQFIITDEVPWLVIARQIIIGAIDDGRIGATCG